MKRKYVIYDRIGQRPVTARFTMAAAERFCNRDWFRRYYWRYEP